jgi:predicted nucleic acid-binding protein
VDLLVDSSVWIGYFNGSRSAETDLLDRLLGRQPIVTGDLILAEVLQGFAREADYRRAKAALAKFPARSLVGPEVALQSAHYHRLLRARGVTVRKTIDCLIATHCLMTATALLHLDRDFDAFERHFGLAVLHAAA